MSAHWAAALKASLWTNSAEGLCPADRAGGTALPGAGRSKIHLNRLLGKSWLRDETVPRCRVRGVRRGALHPGPAPCGVHGPASACPLPADLGRGRPAVPRERRLHWKMDGRPQRCPRTGREARGPLLTTAPEETLGPQTRPLLASPSNPATQRKPAAHVTGTEPSCLISPPQAVTVRAENYLSGGKRKQGGRGAQSARAAGNPTPQELVPMSPEVLLRGGPGALGLRALREVPWMD